MVLLERQVDTMKNTTDKSEIHLSICKELNDLYIKKNADYSDSFAKLRNKFGNVAIILRLYDKLMRAEQLMLSEDEQMVKDESIDDTLRDLANYCLLELTERQYEHNRQCNWVDECTDTRGLE